MAILRQQAGLLTEKTRGMVVGRIDTSYESHPKITDPSGKVAEFLLQSVEVGKSLEFASTISHHEFILVVPALGGYEFELLAVEHDESLFPLVIASADLDEKFNICPNLSNFLNTLKAFLNSKKSRLIIRTLMARASGRKPVVGPNGDIDPSESLSEDE